MSNNCIISILLYGSLWCFPIFHGDVFLEGEVLSLSQAKVWQQRREEAAALEGRLRCSAAGPLGLWSREVPTTNQLKDVERCWLIGSHWHSIWYCSICQGKPGNIRQALCLVVFSRSRWCRKFLWIPWSKSGMKATSMRPSSKLTSDTLALQVFTTWSTWCWWRADGHWNCSSCPLRRVAIWECAKKCTRKIMNNPQALIKPTSQDTSTLDTSIGFLHSLHWLPCLYNAYEYRERATPYILVQWLAKFDYFWLVPYLLNILNCSKLSLTSSHPLN